MDQIKGIGLYSKDSSEIILIGFQILQLCFVRQRNFREKLELKYIFVSTCR